MTFIFSDTGTDLCLTTNSHLNAQSQSCAGHQRGPSKRILVDGKDIIVVIARKYRLFANVKPVGRSLHMLLSISNNILMTCQTISTA